MIAECHHELSSEEIERIFNAISIPACPAMIADVMVEAQRDEPDLSRLARLISADAGMSAIALKLANSPLFRAGSPVSNIHKALERLGIRNTVCVVVSVALRSALQGASSHFIEKFWRKTSTLALAAGLIARRQYGVSPDAAYTYALFHDAGIPLMMSRYPDYENKVGHGLAQGLSVIAAEEAHYPCNHSIIGSLLVRSWGLPAIIGQAIRFHHESDMYQLGESTLPGKALSLIAVTQIAEFLADELDGKTDQEVDNRLFSRALAHFGIAPTDMDDLREAIEAARNDA